MKTLKRREVLGGFLGLSALGVLNRLPSGPVAKLKPLPIAKAKSAAQSIDNIWRGVGCHWQHHCPYCCAVWKFAGSIGNGWWYDWLPGGPRTCSRCGQTFTAAQWWTYVSMSHGGGDISYIVSQRPADSYYMIFNQPDDPAQANKDPVTAANRYYANYMSIKHEGYMRGSNEQIGGIGLGYIDSDGHCTSGPWSQSHGGADYLVAFLDRLKELNGWPPPVLPPWPAMFDFYHVHAYYMIWLPPWKRGGAANSAGDAVTFERLKKHLQWVRGELRSAYPCIIPANVPVWVSETSRLTTSEYLNLQHMDILVAWLQAGQGTDWAVQKVAWFVTYIEGSFSGCNLFQANLQDFTAVGEAWEDLV